MCRIVAWHVRTHAFNKRPNLVSAIFQRYALVRVCAQDEVHVNLHSLQLSTVVLMLIGIERIHHLLQLFDHAIAAHIAFSHLWLWDR